MHDIQHQDSKQTQVADDLQAMLAAADASAKAWQWKGQHVFTSAELKQLCASSSMRTSQVKNAPAAVAKFSKLLHNSADTASAAASKEFDLQQILCQGPVGVFMALKLEPSAGTWWSMMNPVINVVQPEMSSLFSFQHPDRGQQAYLPELMEAAQRIVGAICV